MRHVPFIDHRLHVGWSEDMGHGVFTKGPICNGEFIEIAPVVAVKSGDGEFLNYTLAWGDRLVVALGWTMLYNHSDRNSCVFSSNFEHNLVAIMAVRDIAPGEQITVSYGPNWFSSRGMKNREILPDMPAEHGHMDCRPQELPLCGQ